MNEAAIWETAKPLSAELLRAKTKQLPNELKRFAPVFLLISDSARAAIQGFSSTSVKCDVSEYSSRSFAFGDIEGERFCFRSESGMLRFWLSGDRDFYNLVCELAFGGAGIGSSEEEASRPVSKTEERLRIAVFKNIAEQVANAIERALGVSLHRLEIDELKAVAPSAGKEEFVELVLLVNAFSMAAEITIRLLQEDIVRLVPMQAGNVPEKQFDAMSALQRCSFQLQTLFPPESVALDLLLRLKPGSVLPLCIGPDSHVIVKCGNVPVFEGGFEIHQQRIEVRLLQLSVASKSSSGSLYPSAAEMA
jgi:Type III flagellar switch regulator (C-ring) FliN C-term